MDPALEELVDTGEAVDEVTVLVKLRDPARPPAGIRIVAQLGPIATARVQRLAIRQVWEDPSVLSLKAPRWYTNEYGPIIDPVEAAQTDLLETDLRRPDSLELTGRGTVVAH